MPLSDPDRIRRDASRPRIVALWEALAGLRSTLSFMQSGAHPDDETSSMLAALWLLDGIALSYACSTRGEGGQNDIGTEASEALGVLRTAEMERAADRLNMRLYWHSQTADDTLFDFGFSKSGVETISRWGEARTLARFVEIVRTERPDILCPTFLDIPGQHGHHRAMTQAAHQVMGLAADPGFAGCTLPVWQVSKLYLPAWSGAGQAYDDDLPPPPETLRIVAAGEDPVTGFSFARIGQQSRVFHATQGMGRWTPPGTGQDWPLHLAESHVPGPDDRLAAGLPATLGALGHAACDRAQTHIDAALAAFPDRAEVLTEAAAALSCLQGFDPAPEHAHRVARKITQLSRVILHASGVEARGRLDRDWLRQSDSTRVAIESAPGMADRLHTGLTLPAGWHHTPAGDSVTLSGAPVSDPYPAFHDPERPAAPALRLAIEARGVMAAIDLPLEVPPVVLPDHAVTPGRPTDVVNRAATRRTVDVPMTDIAPADAETQLALPDGWTQETIQGGLRISLPGEVADGLYTLPITVAGRPASTVRRIVHDHVDHRALTTPAQVQVRVLDAALPDARIGYIGAERDRVGHWLDRMGCTVDAVSDTALGSDIGLEAYDTLVVGIFALKFRAGLADAWPRIRDWVARGGTLVTLYHRPWDNWAPDAMPARLEIGQPSLRWRVTDQNAVVTPLGAHPCLEHPNTITPEDWTGWHKERGLYFAKSWDDAYTPLLSMADPDEDPHQGALLCGDFGKGRHIHCALILHHQMEKLVPGAFRLMANLCARRG
ncbi:PIG-L family deacetylase [Cognatishimia sp. F0-27]|uniref:PIG-L family deacetylase n=1 Tax=Cognatishimia sp. F0-27 TaxID=2816855 RepID=UPI001D0CBBC6|nr:PIG-L family deacetylase [Cognatishimia sp. F0-27]MCC1494414.1 PIG-L family deacetylase [Cognatishimia sp. F0-27]